MTPLAPAALETALNRVADLLAATAARATEGAPLTVWKEAEKVEQGLAGSIDRAKADPAYAAKWLGTARACISMLRDQAPLIASVGDKLKGAEMAIQQAAYEVKLWAAERASDVGDALTPGTMVVAGAVAGGVLGIAASKNDRVVGGLLGAGLGALVGKLISGGFSYKQVKGAGP